MSELDLKLFDDDTLLGVSAYQLIEASSLRSLPLMGHLFIDIETEPLDGELLLKIVPPYKHKASKHPGDFDPSTVKYGNAKKPEVRARKLEQARERHEIAIKEWEKSEEQGEIEYWESVQEAATLNATRSRVCTAQVTSSSPDTPAYILHSHDERALIELFWSILDGAYQQGKNIYGFSVFNFDLPYLVRRSIILKIAVPAWLCTRNAAYVNWNQNIIDIQRVWAFGQKTYVSLGELAAALDCGGKSDLECDGAMFHQMWHDEGQRHLAIQYAVNDVVLLHDIAEAMGLRLD